MMQRQHNRDSLNAWARKHALLFMHYNYSMMHLAVCNRIGYISGIKFPQQPQTRGCNILEILIVTYLYLIFVGYFKRFILPLSHGLVVPFNSCPLTPKSLFNAHILKWKPQKLVSAAGKFYLWLSFGVTAKDYNRYLFYDFVAMFFPF